MEKTYRPAAIEQSLYDRWEANGWFEPRGDGEPFCIVIPPPNVTGSLHMGHAFEHTLMDVLVRYQRMRGRRTLWQMGTDHAGIATQMLVERQLLARNLDRKQIGREAFLDHVWAWKEASGGTITRQLRRMGSSVAWDSERFTMDEGFSRTVREAFVRLYEQGLVYRGRRLVNWDPQLETAISDLEVDNRQENGSLWHLRYPLADGRTTADGEAHLIVATTRPETMLGDTAVAVHPDDERYRDLVGAAIELPLTGRRIPVIADAYVDPAFGTGCVKITPAHDFNDYEVGQRHGLPLINVFTRDAHLTDDVPEPYRGLERFEARKRIVADLEAAALLERIEPHTLMVPRGDRSGAVIEPYLTEQWFVAMKPLAERAIDVVEKGEVEFVPRNRENLFFAWLRDIQDWCVSRQQWWGHRIPAWYDDAGQVYVGRSEADVHETHGLADEVPLRQDEDVLETWFSSGCWTFGTLGWPDDTEALRTWHPTDVLITGHDIIFFWVARMIMLTCFFLDEVPFRKVYIHGLIRDAEGQKMSKSKGNGLDPLDLIDGIELEALVAKRTDNLMQPQLAKRIEKATRRDFPDGIPAYGTDALRFTLCRLATQGADVNLDLKRVEGYRNFCNKLWNAAGFVFANVQDQDCGFGANADLAPGVADRWIRHRLDVTLDEARTALETFRFDLYAKALYEFVWNEYCDWYLELVKPVFWSEAYGEADRIAARHTLLTVLETLLRALHPVMPFLTETLWLRLKAHMPLEGDTVMLAPWPEADPGRRDPAAAADVEWLKGLVVATRNLRGERDVPPSTAIDLLLARGDATDRTRVATHGEWLRRLAKVERIDWLEEDAEAPPAALQLAGDLEVRMPLAGLVDVEAEITRLDREIAKRAEHCERIRAKLANEKFVGRAPPEVVEKERVKLADGESALEALEAQRRELSALAG